MKLLLSMLSFQCLLIKMGWKQIKLFDLANPETRQDRHVGMLLFS